MIEKKEKRYKKVLDLGCGYGKHSIYLAENDFQVTSVDISVQVLEWLKEYRKGIYRQLILKN